MRFFSLSVFVVITLVAADFTDASIVIGDFEVSGNQTVSFAGRTQSQLDLIASGSVPEPDGIQKVIQDIANFGKTSPDAISITGFDTLSITATGTWANTANLSSNGMGPSGNSGDNKTTKAGYRIFGISGMSARLNTLIGVFLSDDIPDPNGLPEMLSVNDGDDMTTPLLNQTFAIGADLSNIIVPENATRLFLGHHDGQQFKNNSGLVTATITGTSVNTLNAVPEPSTILIWLVLGMVGYTSMRFRSFFSV
ncbi:MAG: hypothetical protein CMJ77_01745 [Planctomycetaceae bacterium]|nr:hypothetical protein [Planctomycetaceae bacterium]